MFKILNNTCIVLYLQKNNFMYKYSSWENSRNKLVYEWLYRNIDIINVKAFEQKLLIPKNSIANFKNQDRPLSARVLHDIYLHIILEIQFYEALNLKLLSYAK